jgi:8-hydroxy-5-deazaflavin:NADPH oxidoreductase
MRVAVIGPGRIGGNIARLLAAADHEVTVSFSRDADVLRAKAEEIGATPAPAPDEAVHNAEIVVLSVPWSLVPEALRQVGPLADRILVDTTNQFGSGPMPASGQTAAAFNRARMPGARYTKSFNTLTAAFQAETAHREPRIVQWMSGDDPDAKEVVAGLIRDAGYESVDLGGTADCAVMEAPRRPGAVYGEEYRLPEARLVAEAVRASRPIPPTPSYERD